MHIHLKQEIHILCLVSRQKSSFSLIGIFKRDPKKANTSPKAIEEQELNGDDIEESNTNEIKWLTIIFILNKTYFKFIFELLPSFVEKYCVPLGKNCREWMFWKFKKPNILIHVKLVMLTCFNAFYSWIFIRINQSVMVCNTWN